MSEEQNYDQSGQNEEAMDAQQAEHGAGDGAANGDGGQGESDDDRYRKLFVGGLSWETKESDLQEYMSKYGKVVSCNLKKDLETNRSRGFGFVVFEESDSLEKVLAEKEHKLQGKTIDPKRANPKGKWQEPPIKKIYVAKVSPTTTEDQIKEYFSQWGKVEKIEAPFDKEKETRRNFVFVEFDTEETVNKVLNHTTENPDFQHKIGSDEIEIKKATPGNRGRGRGGFGDRGGRGGRGRGGYGGYGGWNDYNQGYGGYGNGYGGYGNYGYGGYGYGGYDPNYGYGGGWGGYDQSGYYAGYGGYGGGGGGYDYSGGWGGYDQSGQQAGGGYGKAPKSNRGGSNSGYRPY
ncbi:heterogeneous nuclear ribonucleoprotein D-like-B isoform X3 [Ruditapes philippinarum]|uniref:heterogeneous nuclear ribonucleoprotein D-like-B isoform X3 n=1 Tax=Ruditapes philippinarum TaxID=129788 RepID=UPI00295B7E8A|nr:heterogeneous nuclear ribonucleoprotein D-like-B isoform X3 [Ruditapes philippinarum]